MRRENSPGLRSGVPLNIMCSSTWATPEVPSTSSMEPTRTHSMWATVGARRSGRTISVMPLDSVKLWATGVAEGGVEGCADDPKAAKASAMDSAARRPSGRFRVRFIECNGF